MNPIQTIRAALESVMDTADWGACQKALAALAELERTSVAAGQEPVAWLVCSVNSDGSLSLEHAAAWKEDAHAHINDAIAEHGIEEAASWVVRPAYVAAPVAQQPNEWREAVLDWLAPTGKDFPTDTPPREIVKWLMNFEHEVAQQPQAETVGCDYCSHPLYAGTKCPSCGRDSKKPQAESVPPTHVPVTPEMRQAWEDAVVAADEHPIDAGFCAMLAASPQQAEAVPTNCTECRNTDSWGVPDQPVCRSCRAGSAWEPLNKSSVNPNKKPQAEVGNSGFDHKTAADFLSGKTISDEAVRKFVQASRWAHDDRASLQSMLLSVRNELASREAEIALLKKELMDADAAPQQAEAVPPGVTDAMVDAYLQANDAYWRETDAQPKSPAKWRNGNPKEATRVSLAAALAAAQGEKP